jgi:general secretion pathway protein H
LRAIILPAILPAVPRATTRAKLESYAVETAALLKADRTAALRRQIQVATQVDAEARSIRSGVTGRVIRFPADVTDRCYLASRCADRSAGRSIDFFPRGCRAAAPSRWRGRAWAMRFASTG